MQEQRYKVAGWLADLFVEFQRVNTCGQSVGLGLRYTEKLGGGVMDYHEAARLHQQLGQWLREVEESGAYREQVKEFNELNSRHGFPLYKS